MLSLGGYEYVFLDTPTFIYYIEEDIRYLSVVDTIFGRVAEGYLTGISSFITLIEVLIKPLKGGDSSLAEKYRDFLLNSANLDLFPLDVDIALKAASLRTRYNVKTPDAIQLATAQLKGAELFITNDKHLPKCINAMKVLLLSDYA